jgi:hypothetical protein
MRTALLLCLITLGTICHSADISVGGTRFTIPASETHRELSQKNPMLQMIRSVLPPEYKIHYAEALVAEMPNGDGAASGKIPAYQVVISYSELDEESFEPEDFLLLRETLVEGLKEGLEEATADEAVELMRRTLAQRTQSSIDIAKPTLIGEPEVTESQIAFTMLMTITVGERRMMQVARGSMRLVKDKILILYSYQDASPTDAIARVTAAHAAFTQRLARANSLILPGDSTVDATPEPTEPPPAEGESLAPIAPTPQAPQKPSSFIP